MSGCRHVVCFLFRFYVFGVSDKYEEVVICEHFGVCCVRVCVISEHNKAFAASHILFE